MSESPYGLIWARGTRPYGTLGSARQHPVLGTVNEARVVGQDGRVLGPGRDRRDAAAQPRAHARVLGHAGGDRRACSTTAGCAPATWSPPSGDGTYTFVARQKEVLRRRGENLSPLEVEEVLEAHPAVLECAVVGVPSELSEDEVKAFVVPADGASRDFAELRAFAAGRLAAFKVPRYWQEIDELPRTPDGAGGQAPASRPGTSPASTIRTHDRRARAVPHVDRDL